MPTAILRPAAIGTYDAWTLTAGASKVAAIDSGDPVSHDDATSYLTATGVNRQSFTVLTAGSPGIGAITSLTLKSRDFDPPGAGARLAAFVRVNGVDGVDQEVTFGGTSAWVTRTVATNPLKSGSVALLAGDIKYSNTNFQMGFLGTPDGTNINMTTFWGELVYVQLGVGMVLQLGSLGPLVAVGLSDLPGIAREVFLRTGQIITPDEYLSTWRELREWRWPRHFLMGARP